AQRNEQHLAAAPLVEPQHLETQLVAVPGDDGLDVGHGEHEVIDAFDPHHTSKQYAIAPLAGCSRSVPAGQGADTLTWVTTARAPGEPHGTAFTLGPSPIAMQPLDGTGGTVVSPRRPVNAYALNTKIANRTTTSTIQGRPRTRRAVGSRYSTGSGIVPSSREVKRGSSCAHRAGLRPAGTISAS